MARPPAMTEAVTTRARPPMADARPVPVARRLHLSRDSLVLLFAAALVVRLGIAVAVHAGFHGSLILDDRSYHDMAAQAARGQTSLWDPFTHHLYRETATLLVPLTVLYKVFGAHQLVGQAFIALFGAAAAVLTVVLAREVVPRAWALAAGLVVALLPSQALFSALTLKDAQVWCALLVLALLIAIAGRTVGWRLLWLALGVVVLLLLLGHLRRHTFVIASIALALAGWWGQRPGRLARGVGALAIAVVVPWTLGFGPLGLDTVPTAKHLTEYRAAQSTGGTAVVKRSKPKAPSKARAAKKGRRPVQPETVRLEDLEQGAFSGNLRHLPRGVSVILLEPFPWTQSHNNRLLLARLEEAAWYPLLALAVVGLVAGRRQLRVLAFPILAIAGIVATDALAEGNVGTAFRHRGELVWAVVVLAAIGAHRLWGRSSRC